jgi:hypothetical protein
MKKLAGLAFVAGLLMLGAGDQVLNRLPGGISLGMISTADARVGRPLTPLSYAGVARRTTRRAIRRGAYIASLPGSCVYGTYYGYSLYRCGGAYYQRSGGGYVVVYF